MKTFLKYQDGHIEQYPVPKAHWDNKFIGIVSMRRRTKVAFEKVEHTKERIVWMEYVEEVKNGAK